MSLRPYHGKRNFKRTPEPAGRIRKKRASLLYCIQKHDASHLHYDLRLEMNGVLKSWAVPKGPSLDPTIKRLAVHVEDHPIQYGSFAGVIPAGQYGAGTVTLWDTGEWECINKNENTETAYKKGHLVFILKGKKLKGEWSLIRMKKNDKNWLFIKINDRYAKTERQYEMTKNDFSLTHPKKILYPALEITKLEVAEYYHTVAKWMLPYISKRPLSVVRCPQGQEKKCFYQKHFNEEHENHIYSVMIKDKLAKQSYLYIKDEKGLIALVQLNVLEMHLWGCHIDKIEKPDLITFDLDPAPEVEWKQVVETAFFVKEQLEKIHLTSFVKTTGGKGLHVVIPIKRLYSWKQIETVAHGFADHLVSLRPHAYIATMSKAKRTGKIFIDYLRNQRGATIIAPYSMRAKSSATISTPLHWDELSHRIKPDAFTIQTIPTRLARLREDPWKDFFDLKQALPY